MKFITSSLFENPDAFAGQLTQVIADPGAFIPRIRHSESDYEPLYVWQARAVISMFQPINASDGSAHAQFNGGASPLLFNAVDGSAQPVSNEARRAQVLDTLKEVWPEAHAVIAEARNPIILGTRPQSSVSEFRALLDSAKGVTADQLELILARGHLKEAARVCTELKQENDQLRGYLRIAGDLLGRADADPVKLAQKVELGIIAVNEDLRKCRAAYAAEREQVVDLQGKVEGLGGAVNQNAAIYHETLSGLEQEADKARRVIAGNANIENSGSLLDMLNALLSKLTAERAERQDYASRLQGVINYRDELRATVERLREKQALHAESNGMLTQERDRAIKELAKSREERREAREAYLRTNPELVGNPAQGALAGLVAIIDKAGLMNLSNGVELGQTSWYVKASDALEFARTQLPACKKCGAKSAALEEGLCGNCAPL